MSSYNVYDDMIVCRFFLYVIIFLYVIQQLLEISLLQARASGSMPHSSLVQIVEEHLGRCGQSPSTTKSTSCQASQRLNLKIEDSLASRRAVIFSRDTSAP